MVLAQYPEKLIPKFILALKNGEKCTIHGEGKTERSFLFVSDVVRAFELILFFGKLGEIYNIGTNKEYSVLDITKSLVKIIKGDDDISKYIDYVEDRKYNDKRYFISFDKLIRMGWEQKVFLEEGLRKTIDYYL